jgi:steroid 5-alpha reductase family enzyme
MFPVLVLNASVLLAYVMVQWLASLRLRDASIVDRFWGGGFAMVAVSSFVYVQPGGWRAGLLALMSIVWGLRLSIYLTLRNWGRGEDYRYQAMRGRHGAQFPRISLFTVFLLQGALAWIISLPLQLGIASKGPQAVTLLDVLGVVLWIAGLAFESAGDAQLARFKADPKNAGRVMDRGLWRYTRHPNYFGDALVWWGLYLVAASTPWGVYSILSPALMQFLLMRVSGVALLERRLVKSRPGYAEYAARTNAFYPWRPRGARRASGGKAGPD